MLPTHRNKKRLSIDVIVLSCETPLPNVKETAKLEGLSIAKVERIMKVSPMAIVIRKPITLYCIIYMKWKMNHAGTTINKKVTNELLTFCIDISHTLSRKSGSCTYYQRDGN
jgi:hypothetical protein